MIHRDFQRKRKRTTDFQSLFSSAHYFLILVITGTLSSCHQPTEKNQNDLRPNILLIVADDLGYADLGCYGGDIETGNIDALANQGIRFSRFHTSPLCAPTRAMLLSGNDNHIAGMGIQGRIPGYIGYEGHLSDRIIPVPELLRQAGYHTSMAGKWHLGIEAENNPKQKGFNRSFVTLRGAANHYNDQGLFKETPKSLYTEDGQVTGWPKNAYSTDLYTDKLIEFISEAAEKNQPFFAFAAYTSPHWPLQVDDRYWQKYEGRYDEGYEALKTNRLKSLQAAGMIPNNATLPPNHESVKPWDSLSNAEKQIEARKMELYAGMVDNLDHNVGRIINHLKTTGQYDNTLIVFMADNGAAAEDFYDHSYYGPFLQEHFTNTFENMGDADSFFSYGPQWAEAGTAPFRYFKGLTTEGGIVAPMIIAGPGVERKQEIHHGFLTLMDLAPTFYEIAKTKYPENIAGRQLFPLKGTSLVPFLSSKTDQIHSSDYVFGLEHNNFAMIRKGHWKITNIIKPFDEENFELYDIEKDFAELRDLRTSEPEKYEEMILEWHSFSKEIAVQIPAPFAD